MSTLVKRLLELGANPSKRNERGYRPVDCADDHETRDLFITVTECKSFMLFGFSFFFY